MAASHEDTMSMVTAKVEDYRKRYRGTKSQATTIHDYFCLIARQVKVAYRSPHQKTPRQCMERIAAMAILALESDTHQE